MQLDIKKAILLPFSDSDWKRKLLILLFFWAFLTIQYYLPNNLNKSNLIYALLTLPFWFLGIGYCLQYAHNEINEIIPKLPIWQSNFLNYLKHGFFSTVISVSYLIPLKVIGRLTKVLFWDNYLQLNIINFIYYIFILALIIILSMVVDIYANNFKFIEAFNINKLFKLIIKAPKELFISALIFLLTLISQNLLVSIFSFHFSAIIFISILDLLSALIVTNLFAQSYKIAKQKAGI